jgi:hypothetical protein
MKTVRRKDATGVEFSYTNEFRHRRTGSFSSSCAAGSGKNPLVPVRIQEKLATRSLGELDEILNSECRFRAPPAAIPLPSAPDSIYRGMELFGFAFISLWLPRA